MPLKVLLFPFPRCMWGGHEGHPDPYLEEQILRVRKTVEIAHDYQKRGYEFSILCASGCENKDGMTLAETLTHEIVAEDPNLIPFILRGERKSTNTAESIRLSKDILIDQQWFKVIAISTGGNPGHIDRIGIYFRNICPGVRVELVASEEVGPPEYRRRRSRDEKIMIFLTHFDPQAKLFDLFGNRRRAQARRKP